MTTLLYSPIFKGNFHCFHYTLILMMHWAVGLDERIVVALDVCDVWTKGTIKYCFAGSIQKLKENLSRRESHENIKRHWNRELGKDTGMLLKKNWQSDYIRQWFVQQ